MSTSPTLSIPNLELVSTLRVSPLNGPPSSQDYNDGEQEKLVDLTTIVTFLNNTLLPMINTLITTAASGLDGSGLYSDMTSEEVIFFNSQTSQSLSVADTMRMLYGFIQSLQTAQSSIGVQIGTLQSRLASSNQNDISLALQGFTSNLNSLLGQLTSVQQAVSNLQLLAGTSLDAQTPTGTIPASSIETVVVNWSVPFSSNDYTVAYGIEDASGFLQITGFTYLPSGAGVQIHVMNNDPAASHQGTVHAVGRQSQLVSS